MIRSSNSFSTLMPFRRNKSFKYQQNNCEWKSGLWLHFNNNNDTDVSTIISCPLTCPVQSPTTRSAMKVSSVSPERWLTITPQPFAWANLHLKHTMWQWMKQTKQMLFLPFSAVNLAGGLEESWTSLGREQCMARRWVRMAEADLAPSTASWTSFRLASLRSNSTRGWWYDECLLGAKPPEKAWSLSVDHSGYFWGTDRPLLGGRKAGRCACPQGVV